MQPFGGFNFGEMQGAPVRRFKITIEKLPSDNVKVTKSAVSAGAGQYTGAGMSFSTKGTSPADLECVKSIVEKWASSDTALLESCKNQCKAQGFDPWRSCP